MHALDKTIVYIQSACWRLEVWINNIEEAGADKIFYYLGSRFSDDEFYIFELTMSTRMWDDFFVQQRLRSDKVST